MIVEAVYKDKIRKSLIQLIDGLIVGMLQQEDELTPQIPIKLMGPYGKQKLSRERLAGRNCTKYRIFCHLYQTE